MKDEYLLNIEQALSNINNILESAVKTVTTIENWCNDHEKRKYKRRDERLARYTKKELKYFAKDYKVHPERYELVSKAEIKAARKRAYK